MFDRTTPKAKLWWNSTTDVIVSVEIPHYLTEPEQLGQGGRTLGKRRRDRGDAATTISTADAEPAIAGGGSGATAADRRAAEFAIPWPKPLAAWYGVWLIASVSMLSNIDRGVINIVVRPIKADLLLSDTEVSLLIGFAFSFFYIIVGFPLSRLIDRGNRRNIMCGALALWSLATAVCGVATSFVQFFIARGIVGGSESAKGPTSISMIADLVKREKMARAYSIFSLGITGGMAFALVIGGTLLAVFNRITPLHVPIFGELHAWQLVFMVVSIPGILVALLIYFTVPEPARHGKVTTTGSVPLKDVFRFFWLHRKIYAPLIFSVGATAIDFFGLEAWRPTFVERTFGWGPGAVGPILGFSALAAAPIGLFMGTAVAEWLDRKGYHDALPRSMLIGEICSLPFVVAGPLMPNPWLAIGVSMLGVAFYWMKGPGENAALLAITPNEMRAQISAVYLFVLSALGGAIGPTFIALITDYALHDEAKLRYAMAVSGAILMPIGIFLIWLSLKPFSERMSQIIEEESQ